MRGQVIVFEGSDGLALLEALQAAVAVCAEHGASLHDRAGSIRAGWVHEGFKAGEVGACAADRLGDVLDARVRDYLRLAVLVEDTLAAGMLAEPVSA